MRTLILTTLTALTLTASAQVRWKYIAMRSGVLVLSGACDATAEVLRINYAQYKSVHKNANDQFCNPAISWTNKWRNGDPEQGDAFFLSSNALVWTTDKYHMMRAARNVTMIAAICNTDSG